MSTSKHLRETHTELGGGRGIFTQGAKVLEGNLAKQVQALIPCHIPTDLLLRQHGIDEEVCQ